jgi:hypothetical protein
MNSDVKAIDVMYYVATPEFIGRWNEAKKGELVPRETPSAVDARVRAPALGS